MKTKEKHTKSLAVPASMSASPGITEPAVFGVNLRFMKSFICAMIGGAAGALAGSVTGLGATATGVTGLPGYLIASNPITYTLVLAVSFALATTFVTFRDNKEVEEGGEEPEIEEKDIFTAEREMQHSRWPAE